jgi:molecular chaperone GrpE
MSEHAPPGIPANAAGPAPAALTPEAVEAVLADFRSWLLQVPAEPHNDGEAEPARVEPVDLHTLLGQFLALRHEINLQTRAARTQAEQSAEALRQLGQALELLRQPREAPTLARTPDLEEAVRPLLKTLIDLYDALALASREVQRVESVLLPAFDQLTAAAGSPPGRVQAEAVSLSVLARLFGAGSAVRQMKAALHSQQAASQQQAEQVNQAVARVRQLVTSLVTGYSMSVQRLERALSQSGLEPIRSVGEPFDPEVMEAVEVVAEPGRQTSEVIEEVRRGYRWCGRMFRFAQVKVARPLR